MNGKQTGETSSAKVDLASIRAKLDGVRGQHYWRSLEEIADTAEFREVLHREFPEGASEWWDGLSRRNFLKLAAASLALSGLTACTKQPVHQILPYVKQPEELTLGEPLFYASAMCLGGFATGILVKNREGHPIKIEGNPDHPSSLGGSSIWMQASLLDLYDPDRSHGVAHFGDLSSYDLFLSDLNQLLQEHSADNGAGLRFLTETVTSPTLAAQISALLDRFPQAKWHQYEPITRDNVREGARLAFGDFVETHYRFDKAAVILSLDSDFLYTHPERLRYTRHFTDGRRIAAGKNEMNRLYVAESTPTITGMMADHRLPTSSMDIESLARELLNRLGSTQEGRARMSHPAADTEKFLAALANDLQQHRGSSIIIAGESQPPIVHALAHSLNDRLGNVGQTLFYTDSAEANPVNQLQSLRQLVDAMRQEAVKTLFILGGNPAYTAPADFDFSRQLQKIPRTIHLGLHHDETAALCTWHIPEAHYLESWGDARAFDGTVSIMQPLIAPLYSGKTAHEILGAMMQQQPIRSDYEIVREFWRAQKLWPDFERGWRKSLHDGLIAGTAFKPKAGVRPSSGAAMSESPSAQEHSQSGGGSHVAVPEDGHSPLELTFRPDPNVWDGRFANNGWLQECPHPANKLSWDNAAYASPTLAQKLNLDTNDIIEIFLENQILRAPVWIMPGQAENSITLPLGYGRTRAGRVGNGVGSNAYTLRHSNALWCATGIKISKTNLRHQLVSSQTHHAVESPERQVYRAGTLKDFLADANFVKDSVESPKPDETLYDPDEYKYTGYKWGMSIDLTTCIGCNACLVACEVENNIPVVGKDQIARRRDMFWIRVDTYYKGALDNPEFHHMPVPCMQCEHAPCELVCPVAATLHDHEGINLQVYNRCVGTRFCSNNCPYKVRRFNFYQYTKYHEPSLQPLYNPEVTVRWRGVMEKCTYCIQRINNTRIAAEKENRHIRPNEIQTACQQACPAEAIIFGDLNNPESKIAKYKQHPLDYSMLGQLNTRPRTTYLAKVRNPNDATESPSTV